MSHTDISSDSISEMREQLTSICPPKSLESCEYAFEIERLCLTLIKEGKSPEPMQAILDDEDSSLQEAIMAFYGLCVINFRLFDISKFEELINKYRPRFIESEYKQLFLFQQAILFKTKGGNRNYSKALKLWGDELHAIRHYPAFAQTYADTIALYYEANDERDQEFVDAFDDALKMIEKACKEKPEYARYHATYGRLLALDGKPDDGIKYIRKAIDKEDPNNSLYALSMIDYQNAIMRIQLTQQRKTLQAELEEQRQAAEQMQASIEKAKYDNLVVLGVFAALVSLLISSCSLADANRSLSDIICIILLLGGTTALLFAALLAIVHPRIKGDRSKSPSWGAMVLIGAFMIIAAFLAPVLLNLLAPAMFGSGN